MRFLALSPGDRVLDCTVGGAGHGLAILSAIGEQGFYWGLEQDPRTFQLASSRLASQPNPYSLIADNFANLEAIASAHGIAELDAVLFDCGTSLFQLKDPTRGFSFQEDGPLDMRMNPHVGASAAEIVNTWPESRLKQLFSQRAEERFSGRIAAAIVKQRRQAPFQRTSELSELIVQVVGYRERIHPATRVFQALRMEVNQELESLEQALPVAVSLLKPGGRIAVISFHSGEDRVVKNSFRQMSKDCICPPRQPVCTCQQQASLGKPAKPVSPSEQEIKRNPPSRSARLRVATRV